MLLPVFKDLIKAQWRTVLETLKQQGDMPVTEIASRTGGSYMGVKVHCEELTKAGYLVRTRVPRKEVGRPEIFYSLSAKADALFPQAGMAFTLELLEHVRRSYGESAPEKLLFQYFQEREAYLEGALRKYSGLSERAAQLAALRTRDGCASRCEPGPPLRIIEHHNPLQRLFEHFPRAAAMETRMIERALGARVIRSEQAVGRETTPRVLFEVAGA